MPIQRGKKRKRTRRHAGREEDYESSSSSAVAETPRPKPKIMRRGHQPPPVLNLGFGVLMFVAGIFFFVTGLGASGSLRFILLFLYVGVGSFYLSRALRQYKARREV